MSSSDLNAMFHPLDGEHIARAVWAGLKPYRDGFHRTECPTSAARAIAALGTGLPGECARCHELFTDTLVHLSDHLDKLLQKDNPYGYARVAAVNCGTTMLREQRSMLQAPTRPERTDGVVGRVRVALADPWLSELFTLMLDAVGRLEPVRDEIWPYERFVAVLAERIGQVPDTLYDRIRADVARVLDVAAEVAGAAWVDATVVAPLLAREEYFALPLVGDDPSDSIEVAYTGTDPDDEVTAALRLGFVHHLCAGTPAVAAVQHAVDELDLPAPHLVDARLAGEVAVKFVAEWSASTASQVVAGNGAAPTAATLAAARALVDGRATRADLDVVLREAARRAATGVGSGAAPSALDSATARAVLSTLGRALKHGRFACPSDQADTHDEEDEAS